MPKSSSRKHLTQLFVDRLRPPAEGRLDLFDADVLGFGVRVAASGRRTYFLRARIGKQMVRMSWPARSNLDPHGLALDAARAKAREARTRAREGDDPRGVATAARPSSFQGLATYCGTLWKATKRPATIDYYDDVLTRFILPAIGRMKLEAIKPAHVRGIHTSMADVAPTANRVHALIRAMFNLAIKNGWLASNPAVGIERYREEPRERYLTAGELDRLWAALARHWNQSSANAIRLLLLTGARRGEVLGASWGEFDLDAGTWTKPGSRTKSRRSQRLPLNGAALGLLRTMKPEDAKADDPLFPSDGKDRRLSSVKSMWRTVTEQAGLGERVEDDDGVKRWKANIRIHDLRHSHAAFLAARGLSLHTIGKLLGHRSPTTTARYAHVDATVLREAAEVVGEVVAAATARGGGNVVPLKRPGGSGPRRSTAPRG